MSFNSFLNDAFVGKLGSTAAMTLRRLATRCMYQGAGKRQSNTKALFSPYREGLFVRTFRQGPFVAESE